MLNKKGNIFSSIIENGVGIISAMLIIILGVVVVFSFSDGLNQADVDQTAKDVVEGSKTVLTTSFDWMTLVVMVSFVLGSVLIVQNSPRGVSIFLFWALFLFLGALTGMIMSNIYSEFKVADTAISTVISNMPIANFLFTYFPYYFVIHISLLGWFLWSRGAE
jgi:hypothetical protein